MTEDERRRHRALADASAHMDMAVKDLSATIKQALQSPRKAPAGLKQAGIA